MVAHVGALAAGKARLLAAADAARDARGEGEWRAAVQNWPPVAFEIARGLRELGTRLDEMVGGDDGEDFQCEADGKSHIGHSGENGGLYKPSGIFRRSSCVVQTLSRAN